VKAVKSASEQPRLAGQEPSCRGGVLRVSTRPSSHDGKRGSIPSRRRSAVEGVKDAAGQGNGLDHRCAVGVPAIRRPAADLQRALSSVGSPCHAGRSVVEAGSPVVRRTGSLRTAFSWTESIVSFALSKTRPDLASDVPEGGPDDLRLLFRRHAAAVALVTTSCPGSPVGLPVTSLAPVEQRVKAGDHVILIVRLLHTNAQEGAAPLVHHDGQYHQVSRTPDRSTPLKETPEL
jgi:hypothetical protein